MTELFNIDMEIGTALVLAYCTGSAQTDPTYITKKYTNSFYNLPEGRGLGSGPAAFRNLCVFIYVIISFAISVRCSLILHG